MIKKFERITEDGGDAKVLWYYDFEDEDMKEAGEDFKVLSKLNVEILGASLG
jgi:hypothetical protein